MLDETEILRQDLVSEAAVADPTNHISRVEMIRESKFNLACLVQRVFTWSGESVRSKLARLSSNWDIFRAPMIGMTGTGR